MSPVPAQPRMPVCPTLRAEMMGTGPGKLTAECLVPASPALMRATSRALEPATQGPSGSTHTSCDLDLEE